MTHNNSRPVKHPRKAAERKSGSHETFVEHAHAEGPSDRSFGLTVGAILIAIALVRWFRLGLSLEGTAVLAVPGAMLVVLGVAAPRLLAPLNRLWMKLGLLLSRIVNPVIMFLMFSLIFVPTALLMRLYGRDALRLRPDPGAKSYWIEREPPGPEPKTMVNPF